MKVIVPRYSGFCPGVRSAEKRIFEERARIGSRKIWVYGSLIHNRNYISFLEGKGIVTASRIDDLPSGEVYAVRTHGVSRKEEELPREKGEVIDLTCSKEKAIQRKIAEHAESGFFTVISGSRSHPEVMGLVSYAREHIVVENEEGLEEFLADDRGLMDVLSRKEGILIVSQTTGSRSLFELISSRISGLLGSRVRIVAIDTTCSVMGNREREALKRQMEVDVTFVVGDRRSSNARGLFEAHRKTGLFYPGSRWAESIGSERISERSGRIFLLNPFFHRGSDRGVSEEYRLRIKDLRNSEDRRGKSYGGVSKR